MKNLKKVLSLALVVVMIFALGATALAAPGDTYKLEINSSVEGHTYEAYQVFAGDLSESGAILSNIVWGSSISESNDLYAALTTAGFAGATAAEIAESLSGAGDDGTQARKFAAAIEPFLSNPAGSTNGMPYVISGLGAGYYLVKDKDGTQNGENGAYTRFMLQLLNDVTATPKMTIPTVDKEVAEGAVNGEGGEYGDIADYNIGDIVPFKLTATIPAAEIDSYTNYTVVFHDTLSGGLTLNTGSFTYSVNGEDKGAIASAAGTGGETFTVTVGSVETFGANTEGNIIIEVFYTATLNQNAVICPTSNPNEVYLEYSNNPNSNSTGETTPVEVDVYTYVFEIYKYTGEIGSDSEEALANARFALYTEVDADGKGTGDAIKVSFVETNADGVNVYRVNPAGAAFDAEGDAVIVSPENGKIAIEGLDAGTYYLQETEAPDGFNLIEEAREVIVNKGVKGSTSYVATVVNVENKSGAELPSTGGIGTTIFYIVGAALICVAVVLLIVKKRKNEATDN